jgi:hypothetical protein
MQLGLVLATWSDAQASYWHGPGFTQGTRDYLSRHKAPGCCAGRCHQKMGIWAGEPLGQLIAEQHAEVALTAFLEGVDHSGQLVAILAEGLATQLPTINLL